MKRTAALLAKLRSRGEVERVALVAAIGAAASWLTYEFVFLLNPLEPKATLSWILAFCLGVLRQHHLHRLITFPNAPVTYGASLARDCASSAASHFSRERWSRVSLLPPVTPAELFSDQGEAEVRAAAPCWFEA